MPIGSTNVYNPGDLILSTVSGSGTSFIETKIIAATSSFILFNSSGTLTSASLNSIVATTSSYVSGSTSIITNLTASNISASGTGSFGMVGIGTTLPSAKLHVVGSSILSNNATINPDSYTGIVAGNIADGSGWGALGIGGNNGNTGRSFGMGVSGTTFYMGFQNGSTTSSLQTFLSVSGSRNLFLVPDGGNVGIGTTRPSSRLQVVSGSGSPTLLLGRDNGYSSIKAGATSNGGYLALDSDGISNGSVILNHYVSDNVWLVTGGGKVGIGTTSPVAKLQVEGNVSGSSFTSSISNAVGFLGTSSWAINASTASYVSPSGNTFVQGGNSFGTTAVLGTNDAQPLALETNGTTRMSINNNGNVAINTSTSGIYRLNIADTHQGSLGSSSLFIDTTQNQNQGLATSANDSGINNVYYVNNFTSSTAIQNQAIYNQLYINGSGSFSGRYSAARNAITLSNTASQDLNGSIINTFLSNQISPNIPTFSVNNWIAGTQTFVDLTPNYNATGSITNLYQHQIGSPFPSGGVGGITVTNSYGIYIGKQKTTNIVTNGWGIYQVDTGDLNIFAGKTRIGSTTVPVNTLDVTGNISASAYTGSSAIITNITASNISASGTGSFGIVGIGTTSPADKLSVISGSTRIASTALAGALYLGNDTSNIYLQRDNSYDLSLVQNGDSNSALYLASAGSVYVNIDSNNNDTDKAFIVQNNALKAGTELFRVSETGNVGIGTTVPADKLEIEGGIRLRTGGVITLRNATNDSSAAIYNAGGAASSVMYLAVGPSPTMTIGGNVGIGTTSPTQRLDLSGSLRIRSAGTYSDPADNAGFINYDSTGGIFTLSARSNGGNTYMAFRTSNAGTAGEKMRIINDGNVGIGTTSPGALLEISSSTAASLLNIKGAGGNNLLFVSASGNVGIGLTNPLGRLHITGSTTASENLLYLSKGSGSIVQNYITAVNQSGQLNYRLISDINGHSQQTLYHNGTAYVYNDSFWSSWINNNNYTQGGLGIGTTSLTHGYGVTIARPATSGSLYVSGSSVFTGSVSVSGSVTFSGPIIYDNAVLLDYGNVSTPVVSTNYVVLQNLTGSYNSAFFDYFASSGSNFRAGTVIAGWSGNNVNYTEYSTTDVGNTNQLSMSVDLSGSFVRLLTTVSTTINWNIKTAGRYL